MIDKFFDTSEFVILRSAENQIGKHRFGKEWVCADQVRRVAWLSSPGTGNSELLEQRFEAAQYLYDYARAVLFPPREPVEDRRNHTKRTIVGRFVTKGELEATKKAALLDISITDEQYSLAFRMSEEARKHQANILSVREDIVRLCQTGAIGAAIRPIPGGAFQKLDRSFWNTERWAMWFEHSTLCSSSPYAFAAEHDHYLFLDSGGLRKLLAEQEVSRLPDAIECEATIVASDRSGGAGAPTSMHLVKQEMKRRHAVGLMQHSLTNESATLSKWLEDTHPTLRQATPKTIMNSLRTYFRELSNS